MPITCSTRSSRSRRSASSVPQWVPIAGDQDASTRYHPAHLRPGIPLIIGINGSSINLHSRVSLTLRGAFAGRGCASWLDPRLDGPQAGLDLTEPLGELLEVGAVGGP